MVLEIVMAVEAGAVTMVMVAVVVVKEVVLIVGVAGYNYYY